MRTTPYTASPFRYIFLKACATFFLRRVALVLANASALGRSINPGEITKSGSSIPLPRMNTLNSNFWDCLRKCSIKCHIYSSRAFRYLATSILWTIFLACGSDYRLSAPSYPCVDNYICKFCSRKM